MSLVKEYFELTQKYRDIYGSQTILLMQVGSFFEVYGKKDKTTMRIIQDTSNIQDFSRICELNVVDKNVCIGDAEQNQCQIVMAGFKDIVIEKYLKKLQEAGFTAVVYTQEEQAKNTTRSLAGIFSPGTYFSNDNAGQLTNNTTCIWIELFEPKTGLLGKGTGPGKGKGPGPGTPANKFILVGIANIDIYTGKTTMFQFKEIYSNNPTTYDELERFISIHCPSEVVMISNLSTHEMDDIISYANIQAKTIHKIVYGTDDFDSQKHPQTVSTTLKNCEKQTYQREILARFYPNMDFENFIHQFLYENHLATQSFCYLLDFVFQHNPHLVSKISEPVFENCSERLILANHSLKQLNIIDESSAGQGYGYGKYSSVIKMLNLCSTPMGKRKFAYDFLNPTTRMEYLQEEYDMTEYLLNSKTIISDSITDKLR